MSELIHQTVPTNGIDMHIVTQGQGPLVVLCHPGFYLRYPLPQFLIFLVANDKVDDILGCESFQPVVGIVQQANKSFDCLGQALR